MKKKHKQKMNNFSGNASTEFPDVLLLILSSNTRLWTSIGCAYFVEHVTPP